MIGLGQGTILGSADDTEVVLLVSTLLNSITERLPSLNQDHRFQIFLTGFHQCHEQHSLELIHLITRGSRSSNECGCLDQVIPIFPCSSTCFCAFYIPKCERSQWQTPLKAISDDSGGRSVTRQRKSVRLKSHLSHQKRDFSC